MFCLFEKFNDNVSDMENIYDLKIFIVIKTDLLLV